MSFLESTQSATTLYQMFFRRYRRWIYICIILTVSAYLYTGFSSSADRVPHIEIAKSSHDWSQLKFHHPIETLQPLPSGKPRALLPIQHDETRMFRFGASAQKQRQAKVKRAMLKSWQNYRTFAWMRDEVIPVTGGSRDTFGGWAATAVDALDTLWIMDLKEEFYEAVQAVVQLDWSRGVGTSCMLFETTIRHLGGLLSAYDLSKLPALLDKAIELGDMLYAGFDTPNHMPPFWLDFEKAKHGELLPDDHQPSATAASLSLEFTRLAQLTGNNKYYDAIARVTDRLLEFQNETMIPGLWPTFFDLLNGNFTEGYSFTLGALSDSMYEYVLKMNLLLAGTEPKYEQMYRDAAETIIQNLLFRPMTPGDENILFSGTARLDDYGNPILDPEGQHLACFAGGMFAMGGKHFNIPEHVEVGARLTKGCIWAYDSSPTGIMPEIFGLVDCTDIHGCTWDEHKWRKSIGTEVDDFAPPRGFSNTRDPRYILRPEALESVFILYRITGREEYRDAAWRMFNRIVEATETEYGFSAIDDVTKSQPTKLNSQESFWLAETLKYAYLIFSSPSTISLDDYVFNTEAHPFRIPKS